MVGSPSLDFEATIEAVEARSPKGMQTGLRMPPVDPETSQRSAHIGLRVRVGRPAGHGSNPALRHEAAYWGRRGHSSIPEPASGQRSRMAAGSLPRWKSAGTQRVANAVQAGSPPRRKFQAEESRMMPEEIQWVAGGMAAVMAASATAVMATAVAPCPSC